MSAKNNDKAIQDLLKKVDEQTTVLGKPIKPAWNTNGIFKFLNGETLNINVCGEPVQFAYALANLYTLKDAFNNACQDLDIGGRFRYGGYLVDEWREDFVTRISVIRYNEKKKLLDASKAKLQALMSEDARTENELNKLAELLG